MLTEGDASEDEHKNGDAHENDQPEEQKAAPKPVDDFIKNLTKDIGNKFLKTESDDSDDGIPKERYFTFDVVNAQNNKLANVDLIKHMLRDKCGEIFSKMKRENSDLKNRLKRSPVWNWEDEKENVDPLETCKLRILAITWNMNAKKPPSDLSSLLRPDIKHDIYAIGSEECLKSIFSSAFGASKKKWVEMLQENLGETYQIISSHSLMGIHLVVFASVRIIPIISNIEVDHVATGIWNSIGNKGGVGISFQVGKTSLLFIN